MRAVRGIRTGLLALLLLPLSILVSAVVSASSPSAAAAALPSGFSDTLVTNVSGPMDVAWTPDGRMLIIGKAGQVRVYRGGTLLPAAALDLSARLCTVGEQGLAGIAVHPNFTTNHYVYLYYIYNKLNNGCPESELTGPVGRLSRFTLGDNNLIDPASELVLLETPPRYRDHHTGGDPKFGKDGLLYLTIGDSGAQGLGWPQNLGNLAGKIVRITDTGGIPAGNPYTGTGTARCNVGGVPPAGSAAGTKCQEVLSAGLRNPFRWAFDPNAAGVRFYVNDVGQHTWEEISEGPVAGGNYGWQVREGPCAKDSDTSCAPDARYLDPVHWYHHGPDGAAATAGAFVPNGVWPASYNGVYLWADYVFGAIYELRPGGPDCRLCTPPTSAYNQVEFAQIGSVVSMRFGPDGGLYYVSRDGSTVRKITFTGTANRNPTATASAIPTSGPLPLTVRFDGAGSTDPDGDPLSYEWDFEDNGTVDSTAAAPSTTYSVAGTYTARLTVRDGRGGSDSTTVRIDAGNRPPVPTIDNPAATATAAVGDSFTLHGSATDPDSGPLPDSALSWEVELVHATHTHPFLPPTSGNDVPISYPPPEDLDAAKDSFLRIKLTATDGGGLSQTVTRDLPPKLVDLTFATDPPGLSVTAGGLTLTGPSTVRSWDKYAVGVNAPDQSDGTGQAWRFASWSDNGAQAHTITTPAAPATYTARFTPAAPPPTTTRTFHPQADTYARADQPTSNFGTRTALRTDGDPDTVSYLRFSLTDLGSPIVSAKLRVFPTSSNSIGYDVRGVSDNGWSETALTYANKPAPGPVARSSGRVTASTWTELDVTSLVTGNGPRSLALTSTSTTATGFASRETATGPELVVTFGTGGADTEPPGIPALSGSAPSAGQVDLSWTAATDNVGVTGYDVFRGGAFLAGVGGAVRTYTDTTVAASTTYAYQVRARDAAGNTSGFSNMLSVTTPAAGAVLTFAPTADAYVRQDTPTTNYGTATSVQVDNSPVKRILLTFAVSGTAGRQVAGAKLRLYCLDDSSSGGDLHRVLDPNAWTETGVTWNNAPAFDPGTVASLGSVTAGTWYELDVTSLVGGDGQVGLLATSPSSNGADYSSRQGSAGFAPQLVVTLR